MARVQWTAYVDRAEPNNLYLPTQFVLGAVLDNSLAHEAKRGTLPATTRDETMPSYLEKTDLSQVHWRSPTIRRNASGDVPPYTCRVQYLGNSLAYGDL